MNKLHTFPWMIFVFLSKIKFDPTHAVSSFVCKVLRKCAKRSNCMPFLFAILQNSSSQFQSVVHCICLYLQWFFFPLPSSIYALCSCVAKQFLLLKRSYSYIFFVTKGTRALFSRLWFYLACVLIILQIHKPPIAFVNVICQLKIFSFNKTADRVFWIL